MKNFTAEWKFPTNNYAKEQTMTNQPVYSHHTSQWFAGALIATLIGLAQVGSAAVVAFSSYTVNGSDELTGFTVGSGTYTDLNAAQSASGEYHAAPTQSPTGSVAETGGNFTNFWKAGSTEVQGFGSISNLNPYDGALNAGRSDGILNGGFLEIYFGASLEGRSGAGNDIFLMDLSGDDAITVEAIDGSGDVVGDQSISLLSTTWGGSSSTNQFYHELNANIQPNSPPFWSVEGVAFDVEDFFSGPAGQIQGIRITGTAGVDLTTAGFTTAAVVPEASSLTLLLTSLFLCVLGFRRRHQ